MTYRKLASAGAAAAIALVLAGGAAAQTAEAYNGETLDMFAATLLEVSEVRDTYASRLQMAETAEQQEAIIAEANAEIVETIRGGGMSLEDYEAILAVASEDEALSERILRRLDDLQGSAG